MRLLFIRHGDPNYEKDALTDVGKIEAEALARHIDYWNIDDIYLSPLGRARETAEYSIKALEEKAGHSIETVTYPWLREFNALVDVPNKQQYLKVFPNSRNDDGTIRQHIAWDMVPSYLHDHQEYFDKEAWRDSELAHDSDLIEQHDWVISNFDKLLAEYGYVRDGSCYRVEKESTKTLAFFCHFGVTSVMLAHLTNCSPFVIWHGAAMAPTSVTEVITEEREQGTASFRAWKIGDVSHLIMEGLEPSFSARFTEVYSDMEHRH